MKCCGVNNYNDTLSSQYGNMFCCKNAHESRMNPGNYYGLCCSPDVLNYFGGRVEYKTDVSFVIVILNLSNWNCENTGSDPTRGKRLKKWN